jgi:hypothetical protein
MRRPFEERLDGREPEAASAYDQEMDAVAESAIPDVLAWHCAC